MTVVRPESDPAAAPPRAPSDGAPAQPAPTAAPAWKSLLRAVWRALVQAVTACRSVWQHSLQVRVATTTFLITGAVVLVIGLFLIDQVTGGVLKAKREASIRQTDVGLADAQAYLISQGNNLGNLTDDSNLKTYMTQSNASSAGLFSIVVKVDNPQLDATGPAVPRALRRAVQAGNLAVEYAPVPNGSGPSVPGLIVGAPVTQAGNSVELYYLFPLTAERHTFALLQRTVLISGIGLVLLVVAITMLITRQVVRPVRVAARTAGRLAAGDLSQRISVRGSDDIARLGRSFNDMAGSLQRQIRRLEDLSRLQRRFTSDVSHELRTPLTTIRMAAEMLHGQREEFPPALMRSAELLTAELDRFEALLADLLEISRYDAGVANLESETSDIRRVVTSTIDANRVLAARHGSTLEAHLPPVPVSVDMDARRVERILRNLVANALDHGEGRPVIVTLGYDDDAVAITVRDHGVGLRPGEAGLVFNRFWRGDPSRSRLTGGTGLGLAISLEDARLHDGWLQAWGEHGKGAQFRLTLPRRAGHTLMSSPLPLAPGDDEEDDE